jgi:hypothetical protein
MKTLLPALVTMLLSIAGSAQYCGTSGPLVCDTSYFPVDTTRSFGSIPLGSLPCIIRGVPYNETITIRTDSVWLIFGGQGLYLRLNSLVIDSIWNLPQGICWATNKPDNRVTNGGWLCLNFNGTTTVPEGIYTVWIERYVSANIPMIPEQDPVTFKVRVRDVNTPCEQVTNEVTALTDNSYQPALINYTDSRLIVSAANQNCSITVSDITGRSIYTGNCPAGQTITVDIPTFTGLMIVTVADGNGQLTRRYVK